MSLHRTCLSIIALSLCALAAQSYAQTTDAITYQCELRESGVAVNDTCDFRFTLWDAPVAGTQLGSVIDVPNQLVENGRITADLDFGDNLLDGNGRWIEIEVRCPAGSGDYTILFPRQEITPSPYALFALAGNEGPPGPQGPVGPQGPAGDEYWLPASFGIDAIYYNDGTEPGNVGIGEDVPLYKLHVVSNTGRAVNGESRGTGQSARGVSGLGSATSDLNYGVYGRSDSTSGYGVYGLATANSGFNYGVYGKTNSPTGYAGYFEGGRSYFEGNVGIGTASGLVPLATLQVDTTTGNDPLRVRIAGDTKFIVKSNGFTVVGANFTPEYQLQIGGSGSAGKPGGGSWSNSSDRRLKKNILSLEGSLEVLLSLRGVSFEYVDPEAINELPGKRIGFIAQEVEPVVPDWIDEGPNGYKRLTVRGFEALTVEALRELRAEKDNQFDTLLRENEELRERLASLESAVEALTALTQVEQR